MFAEHCLREVPKVTTGNGVPKFTKVYREKSKAHREQPEVYREQPEAYCEQP